MSDTGIANWAAELLSDRVRWANRARFETWAKKRWAGVQGLYMNETAD
jgi:hypothetical protein